MGEVEKDENLDPGLRLGKARLWCPGKNPSLPTPPSPTFTPALIFTKQKRSTGQTMG